MDKESQSNPKNQKNQQLSSNHASFVIFRDVWVICNPLDRTSNEQVDPKYEFLIRKARGKIFCERELRLEPSLLPASHVRGLNFSASLFQFAK